MPQIPAMVTAKRWWSSMPSQLKRLKQGILTLLVRTRKFRFKPSKPMRFFSIMKFRKTNNRNVPPKAEISAPLSAQNKFSDHWVPVLQYPHICGYSNNHNRENQTQTAIKIPTVKKIIFQNGSPKPMHSRQHCQKIKKPPLNCGNG